MKLLPWTTSSILFVLLGIILNGITPSVAETQETQGAQVTINAHQRGSEISPLIYGQFIEHLGQCIYGGIWAEMLEDRKFFYPIGADESPWKPVYDCNVRMNETVPFVGSHSPETFASEPRWLGVLQTGLTFKKGGTYNGYIWVKVTEGIERVDVHFHWGEGETDDVRKIFTWAPVVGDYYKINYVFESPVDTDHCKIEIAAKGTGSFFVGTASLMPADNIEGMRADTFALLKELNSPIYRWPGGNFVSGYNWKDGIGDRDQRPPRKNPAWKGIEHNDFGFDEFMNFCRLLKTEAYIAVNTGNGEMAEAVDELNYANAPADTPWGAKRAANGHAKPYQVTWWCIGNEMYGNWQIGHLPVETYVEKHNAFVKAFRKADPNIRVVGVGHVGKWDEIFIPGCANYMDDISEHFYCGNVTDDLVKHVAQIPAQIKRIADAHRRYRQTMPELKGKDIRIAMDEWNYWYGPDAFGEIGTRYFMKDGLGIAAGLHEFFRNSDIYSMANYAQTVNVIGAIKTNKTNAQFETTGLVLKMYREHFGSQPLRIESPSPLDIAAALSNDGKILTVGVVNPLSESKALEWKLEGINLTSSGTRYELTSASPNDYNDPGSPQKITVNETVLDGGAKPIIVPPFSVSIFKWDVR